MLHSVQSMERFLYLFNKQFHRMHREPKNEREETSIWLKERNKEKWYCDHHKWHAEYTIIDAKWRFPSQKHKFCPKSIKISLFHFDPVWMYTHISLHFSDHHLNFGISSIVLRWNLHIISNWITVALKLNR